MSANIYMLLSSSDWCKSVLGLDQALLNLPVWLQFSAIYCVLASIFSFLVLKEPEVDEKPDITISGLLVLIPKILFQKNARWEILITPFFELTYAFVGRYYIIRL